MTSCSKAWTLSILSTCKRGNYVFHVQNYLGRWFKSILITFNSFRVTLFLCPESLQNWYLLCCRIFRNVSLLSRTCLRLSVAQRVSSDERVCLFRQPCKTGLTSCTGDGNSCKFNCCRGNTPCKRLTPVLIRPRYKDYRVSKRLCFVETCLSWVFKEPLVTAILVVSVVVLITAKMDRK